MSLWDEVKQNLAELYTAAADKTTEVARIQSRRYDKFGLSRDIERQFSELGSFVYAGLQEGREGILEAPEVARLLERIQGLEQDLRRKEEEIDRIRREHADRKGAAKPASAAAAAGAAEGGHPVPNVIQDPELAPGDEESAILMEPAESPEPEMDEHDPRFGG